MIKAFNKSNINFTAKDQYMYLSGQPNVSRYDIQKVPIYEKLTKKMIGFFWNPEEIDLSQDKSDFRSLEEHQQFIFIENLKYQTFLDSVISRSSTLVLLPLVSLPELETMIVTWSFNESIHSRSYTHIIRNVFSNPSEIFDDIMPNNAIMDRARSVTKHYDDLIEYSSWYNLLGYGTHTVNGKTIEINEVELKTKLLLAMVSFNILEGVRFFVSFACSFAFDKNGVMGGNSNVIKLIARDENVHLAGTQNHIKKWATGQDDPMMIDIFENNKGLITQMYLDAIHEEKEWAKYLFQYGSMLGLNESILGDFIEYIAGKRMRAIGIKHNFSSKNPISWVDDYLTTSKTQVAPQETEILSYITGSVKQDVDDNTFADFRF